MTHFMALRNGRRRQKSQAPWKWRQEGLRAWRFCRWGKGRLHAQECSASGSQEGPSADSLQRGGAPAHGCEEPNSASNLNGQGSEVSLGGAREEPAILPAP